MTQLVTILTVGLQITDSTQAQNLHSDDAQLGHTTEPTNGNLFDIKRLMFLMFK